MTLQLPLPGLLHLTLNCHLRQQSWRLPSRLAFRLALSCGLAFHFALWTRQINVSSQDLHSSLYCNLLVHLALTCSPEFYKDLHQAFHPKVPAWRLEWESNPRPFG